MKYLLCFCLLWAAGPVKAQTKSSSAKAEALKTPLVKGVLALDAKNGFRSYRFGMPMDKISGLRKLQVSQFEGNVFERPAEPMGVGPVHLTSILFVGIKGRLGSVMLTCAGKANAANLLAVLQQQYGPGLEYSDEHVNWPGKLVTMDYTFSEDDEKCTVIIASNAAAKTHAGLADDAEIKKGRKDL